MVSFSISGEFLVKCGIFVHLFVKVFGGSMGDHVSPGGSPYYFFYFLLKLFLIKNIDQIRYGPDLMRSDVLINQFLNLIFVGFKINSIGKTLPDRCS
jgi:hypothetical protein